jgi:hypothetical protein
VEGGMKKQAKRPGAPNGLLPPVDHDPVAALQMCKAKKRSHQHLKEIRKDKYATKIQSGWRGKLARKSVADQKRHLEIRSELPELDNAEEQVLETYQQIPFENLQRVSFYIDGAIGLPANCTVTRVTARLLTQDRQQVTSLGSTESYCDPQSPCFSPSYDLFLSWKGIPCIHYCNIFSWTLCK